MKECIYQKRYGVNWLKSMISCPGDSHVWRNEKSYWHKNLSIERNICIYCGRTEIMILIDW